MKELGQLKFVEENHLICLIYFMPTVTPMMMIPIINYQGKRLGLWPIYFLQPVIFHMPYVMGYDTRPLLTLEDRKRFYKSHRRKLVPLFRARLSKQVITLKTQKRRSIRC